MNLTTSIRRSLAVTALLSLAACATAEPGADLSATDTHEILNRAMLDMNIKLDRNFLGPASKTYHTVTPPTIRLLVGNEFNYLDLPADFINYVLQGNIKLALHVLGRFTINTVLGGVGLLDPATEFGLPEKDTDFGVTIGKYGAAEGTYWVLPVLGPSTTRDSIGTVLDIIVSPASPLGYLPPRTSLETGIGLRVLQGLDTRDRYRDIIDDVLYESEDPYVALRSVYLQRRRAQVAGEDAAADAIPDIFETK